MNRRAAVGALLVAGGVPFVERNVLGDEVIPVPPPNPILYIYVRPEAIHFIKAYGKDECQICGNGFSETIQESATTVMKKIASFRQKKLADPKNVYDFLELPSADYPPSNVFEPPVVLPPPR